MPNAIERARLLLFAFEKLAEGFIMFIPD